VNYAALSRRGGEHGDEDVPANDFVQLPVNDLVGVAANGALSFENVSGSAVIFGSGVDNKGASATLHLATATRE
jgi:hypothetical protein